MKEIQDLILVDEPIEIGDFFVEVGCDAYIHQLVDTNDYSAGYSDYKLNYVIPVVPLNPDDLEWNSSSFEYKKISDDCMNLILNK